MRGAQTAHKFILTKAAGCPKSGRCRHASTHKPDTPLALCGAIGTLVLLPPAALLAARAGHDLLDVSPRVIGLVLANRLEPKYPIAK